jgi:glutathione S-transferase
MANESAVFAERLQRADAAMAATAERLREGRGSVDEAIRERLVPLVRWIGRVVAIARLWRMQREMWRG